MHTMELQHCADFERFAGSYPEVVSGSLARARTYRVSAGLRPRHEHFRALVALSHLAHLASQPGVNPAITGEAAHVERIALSSIERSVKARDEHARALFDARIRAIELALITTFAVMIATGAPLVAASVRVVRIVADAYERNEDESTLSTDFYDGVLAAATVAVGLEAIDAREVALSRSSSRLS